MKKPFFQSLLLHFLYKGPIQWFLKVFVGINFGNVRFLKEEKQFIIIANHSSHLDALSILSSLPGSIIWKVKAVAAEDYFGSNRVKSVLSNYFINTLLIKRKRTSEDKDDPIKKMLAALDYGYSLIIFPEGTRGDAEQMNKIQPGIAKILAARPNIKYLPVFMTGMAYSLPKGKRLILPYKASIHYGDLIQVNNTKVSEIIQQIAADFQKIQNREQ